MKYLIDQLNAKKCTAAGKNMDQQRKTKKPERETGLALRSHGVCAATVPSCEDSFFLTGIQEFYHPGIKKKARKQRNRKKRFVSLCVSTFGVHSEAKLIIQEFRLF